MPPLFSGVRAGNLLELARKLGLDEAALLHTLDRADLHDLTHLCRNCGPGWYVCQNAPPHEFRGKMPQAMVKLRLQS